MQVKIFQTKTFAAKMWILLGRLGYPVRVIIVNNLRR